MNEANGSKHEWSVFDAHDKVHHHAKFGEDGTTRAGCRCEMWCLFFVLFFGSRSESGAPCVRGAHSSYKHCVAVYMPITTRLSAADAIIALGSRVQLSDVLTPIVVTEEEEEIISSRQIQYRHTKCIWTPNIYNCLYTGGCDRAL